MSTPRKIHNYVRVSEVCIGTYILYMYVCIHTLNLLTVLAGNFCGVLIFVIFVVDLACSHEISHPQKLMPTVESMMMGVAKNIAAARPRLPSVNKQQ